MSSAALVLTLLATAASGEGVAESGPMRVLVVDLAASEARTALARDATKAIVDALRARSDAPLAVRTLDDAAAVLGEAGVTAARSCARGDCMGDIAASADVDIIVFGSLTETAGPRPLGIEVRVFARDAERVVSKGTTDAPDEASLVEASRAMAEQLDLPKREVPVVEPKQARDVFAEPLFIAGVAVAFIGVMVAIAGSAYALQSELFLGDPGIHRDLKSDALVYGPWSIVVAGAGAGVAVVGAGVAVLGFFWPSEE